MAGKTLSCRVQGGDKRNGVLAPGGSMTVLLKAWTERPIRCLCVGVCSFKGDATQLAGRSFRLNNSSTGGLELIKSSGKRTKKSCGDGGGVGKRVRTMKLPSHGLVALTCTTNALISGPCCASWLGAALYHNYLYYTTSCTILLLKSFCSSSM
jgi:hypothetical protein